MAQKNRKHPELTVSVSKDAIGYIRLSVFYRDSHWSVENQKLIIEEWGKQNKIIVSCYHIDNGFSGKRFDSPVFQEMLRDIEKSKIDCVVVKGLSRLAWDYIIAGYYFEMLFQAITSDLYQSTTNLIPPMA